MTFLVRIRPLAQRDVRRAFSWYEQQQPGLGRDFVGELDAVYERLTDNPYAYQDIFHGVRRAVLRRFPYGAFYLVADNEVRVLAVMDMSRDPEIWRRRIDN